MADYEGMGLLATAGSAGALLFLRNAPRTSASVTLDSGVEVECRGQSRALIVRGVAGQSYESVMESAPEQANRGLDVLVMKGAGRLVLDDLSLHTAWWTSDCVSTVRFVCGFTSTLTLSATVVSVSEAAEPLPEPLPPWQESMRYFRMSEVTDDLFDAFRNVYLALESILSHLEPVVIIDGRPEPEWRWFKRALSRASEFIDLQDFVTGTGSDPVDALFSELHRDVRNRVFHAKDGLEVFLPQALSDHDQVTAAKRRYTTMYLRLAEQVFGLRFPSGGLTLASATVEAMTSKVIRDGRISVTSDPTGAERLPDPVLSPRGEPSIDLSASPFDRYQPAEANAVMASVAVVELRNVLPGVGAFAGTAADGTLAVVAGLEGVLNPVGFDRAEFVVAIGVAGDVRPRVRYLT